MFSHLSLGCSFDFAACCPKYFPDCADLFKKIFKSSVLGAMTVGAAARVYLLQNNRI